MCLRVCTVRKWGNTSPNIIGYSSLLREYWRIFSNLYGIESAYCGSFIVVLFNSTIRFVAYFYGSLWQNHLIEYLNWAHVALTVGAQHVGDDIEYQ